MSRGDGSIRLATRGSALAMAQARSVAAELEKRRYDVTLVEVETDGDRIRDELIHRLGTTGAFVRALDERVLEGDVDAAVHSMKDVPTEGPPELVIAGVPKRGPPNDVLVTPDGADLSALQSGATIGTASLRRGAQLRAVRPDLSIEPIRGNVDTRVEKVLAPAVQAEAARRRTAEAGDEGAADAAGDVDGDEDGDEAGTGVEPADERSFDEWRAGLSTLERDALDRTVETALDGIVLSKAGLRRIGLLEDIDAVDLPIDRFVPAPGQGAIAISMLDGDLLETVRAAVDHPRSRVETTVERTILAELGGGCIAPIGVHAVTQGEYVHTAVGVYARDGGERIEETRDLPVESYRDAARDFAATLADRGAADLIEAARRAEEGTDAG